MARRDLSEAVDVRAIRRELGETYGLRGADEQLVHLATRCVEQERRIGALGARVRELAAAYADEAARRARAERRAAVALSHASAGEELKLEAATLEVELEGTRADLQGRLRAHALALGRATAAAAAERRGAASELASQKLLLEAAHARLADETRHRKSLAQTAEVLRERLREADVREGAATTNTMEAGKAAALGRQVHSLTRQLRELHAQHALALEAARRELGEKLDAAEGRTIHHLERARRNARGALTEGLARKEIAIEVANAESLCAHADAHKLRAELARSRAHSLLKADGLAALVNSSNGLTIDLAQSERERERLLEREATLEARVAELDGAGLETFSQLQQGRSALLKSEQLNGMLTSQLEHAQLLAVKEVERAQEIAFKEISLKAISCALSTSLTASNCACSSCDVSMPLSCSLFKSALRPCCSCEKVSKPAPSNSATRASRVASRSSNLSRSRSDWARSIVSPLLELTSAASPSAFKSECALERANSARSLCASACAQSDSALATSIAISLRASPSVSAPLALRLARSRWCIVRPSAASSFSPNSRLAASSANACCACSSRSCLVSECTCLPSAAALPASIVFVVAAPSRTSASRSRSRSTSAVCASDLRWRVSSASRACAASSSNFWLASSDAAPRRSAAAAAVARPSASACARSRPCRSARVPSSSTSSVAASSLSSSPADAWLSATAARRSARARLAASSAYAAASSRTRAPSAPMRRSCSTQRVARCTSCSSAPRSPYVSPSSRRMARTSTASLRSRLAIPRQG
mmetsp:Transcript_4652/g.11232  ORF Transcript_4652/g.11232 Transcript_4652/m.11232 type:complete len:774 (-) Transcript_4652:42-2363(-)